MGRASRASSRRRPFTRNEADHEAVRAFGRDLVEKCFGILDQQLAGKDYVAGTFSIADPILFYVEFWADKTKIPLASESRGSLQEDAGAAGGATRAPRGGL